MSQTAAQPGWWPDPANPTASMRWWDGSRWTESTQPVAPAAPAPAVRWTTGESSWHTAVRPAPARIMAAARPTFWQQNTGTFTVLAVVAGYLALAAATGIVLLGIFPLMLALKAVRRGEPLGFLAVIAAIVAIVAAFATLAH